MNTTDIAWTDMTWNPVTGCTKCSPGCAHCYAERMSKRLAGRVGYDRDQPFKVTLHPDRLDQPRQAKKGKRIFVCSMSDLFHPDVPFAFIRKVFEVMAACPQHTFIVLTKRPERAAHWYHELIDDFGARTATVEEVNRGMPDTFLGYPWPLPNVWLGVTAENQEMADRRLPWLMTIPAVLRFVSVEPMLGPVDIRRWLDRWKKTDRGHEFTLGLDWVIVGGETGPAARPMNPRWFADLMKSVWCCGIPFFFKQWGSVQDRLWKVYNNEHLIAGYVVDVCGGVALNAMPRQLPVPTAVRAQRLGQVINQLSETAPEQCESAAAADR